MTVTGHVSRISDQYALLTIRGWELPLETRFMSWDALKNPAEKLSIGDRVKVMIQSGMSGNELRKLNYSWPKYHKDGYWLNCLPFFENPWPRFINRYKEGSVIEVEMIDYLNWYIARVRMPDGFIIELRINDIHPRSKINTEYNRKLNSGERFRIIFRQIHGSGVWVQRFLGKTETTFQQHLIEAGQVMPCIATKIPVYTP